MKTMRLKLVDQGLMRRPRSQNTHLAESTCTARHQVGAAKHDQNESSVADRAHLLFGVC